MLQGEATKSNLQQLLERIMIILTVLCIGCSVGVFVVLLLYGTICTYVQCLLIQPVTRLFTLHQSTNDHFMCALCVLL